jgi:ABC-type Co2+ transport system permease subunit
MGFGCSYSLVEVDCINWVKTSLSKRILRTILGGVITIAIYKAFQAITFKDQPLQSYCFNQLLPSFFIPFVIYGPFLVMCQKLKLVDTQYPFARSFSRNQPSIIID